MTTIERIHIDIETFSSNDIKSGVYKYAEAEDFQVLLLAYAFDDDPVTVADVYHDGIPDIVRHALTNKRVKKVAYNAQFERVCLSRALGMPVGEYLDPEQWECTMIRGAYNGYPMGLAALGKAMNLPAQKLTTGKDYIRYFCVPQKPTRNNGMRTRNLPEHDRAGWEGFKKYCVGDVVTEIQAYRRLEPIPEIEQAYYELDQRINDRGVLIDIPFVRAAIKVNEDATALGLESARQKTGLDNPNSVKALKDWIKELTGEEIESINKSNISELQKCFGGVIAEALASRKELAKSSIAKYKKMLQCVNSDNRLRGTHQFYGARTGREAGRLVQLQNLPQNHIEPLAVAREYIAREDAFGAEIEFGSVGDVLSQLVRTAIVAPKGTWLNICDFSAIEARVLAWLANEEWKLDVFRGDGKVYEATGARMFGVPVESITKGSDLRARAKVAELACGYGGGLEALRRMGGAALGLSDVEMKGIVDRYREANPATVEFWGKLEKAAKYAITREPIAINVGTPFDTAKITFRKENDALTIQLPSGRKIYYRHAGFTQNKFGGTSVSYHEGSSFTQSETYGGKLTENVTQAVARDLLFHVMYQSGLIFTDPKIVMHVHDEFVVEREDSEFYRSMEIAMTMEYPVKKPEWAKELPLAGDGFSSKFYRK